jgi:hypothetical protein
MRLRAAAGRVPPAQASSSCDELLVDVDVKQTWSEASKKQITTEGQTGKIAGQPTRQEQRRGACTPPTRARAPSTYKLEAP